MHHAEVEPPPDPDWYLDHVLVHASPGDGGRIVVGEAASWQSWWRSCHATAAARWPSLGRIAGGQGHLITTAQLRELGLPRHQERALVRSSSWSRPTTGVVCIVGGDLAAGTPWLRARREHAVQAAAGALSNRGHGIGGRSAAIVHGLPVQRVPDRAELLTVPRANSRHRARTFAVEPAELTTWWGLPVSVVARTLVDLARLDRLDGLMAADAALRQGPADPGSLDLALGRATRWPGVVNAREILRLASPLAESPLESAVRLALFDSRLPLPELQAEIVVPGRRVPYRVDMLWPRQRLVLEADGRAKYTGDELWREKRRELNLRAAGYRVERVVWSDLGVGWPRFAERLRAALA